MEDGRGAGRTRGRQDHAEQSRGVLSHQRGGTRSRVLTHTKESTILVAVLSPRPSHIDEPSPLPPPSYGWRWPGWRRTRTPAASSTKPARTSPRTATSGSPPPSWRRPTATHRWWRRSSTEPSPRWAPTAWRSTGNSGYRCVFVCSQKGQTANIEDNCSLIFKLDGML